MKHRLTRIKTGPDKGSLHLKLELTGTHEIFRFLVNMLDDQTEFADVAQLKLRALRAQIGRDQFDPYAARLLGDDRYERLRHRWGGRRVAAAGREEATR